MTSEKVEEAVQLVKGLYELVDRLEKLFPGRRFTPDGHLVGSLGEVIAAARYGLELSSMSTKGSDASCEDGRLVEIKATQGRSVAFRCEPPHLIVLRLTRDGDAEEIFNGPGVIVWPLVVAKPQQSNGQRSLSLSTLRKLQRSVPPEQRLPLANLH